MKQSNEIKNIMEPRSNKNVSAAGTVISPTVWFSVTAEAEFCFPYKFCTTEWANRQ